MKDDGSFKVVVTPKKGESELEAITNGHYKIKKQMIFYMLKKEIINK